MYQGFNFIAISATLVIDDQNNVGGFTVAPRNSRSGGALVSLLDCEQNPSGPLMTHIDFNYNKDVQRINGSWCVQPGQLLINLFSWLYLYMSCLYGICTDFIHHFLWVICKYFVIIWLNFSGRMCRKQWVWDVECQVWPTWVKVMTVQQLRTTLR